MMSSTGFRPDREMAFGWFRLYRRKRVQPWISAKEKPLLFQGRGFGNHLAGGNLSSVRKPAPMSACRYGGTIGPKSACPNTSSSGELLKSPSRMTGPLPPSSTCRIFSFERLESPGIHFSHRRSLRGVIAHWIFLPCIMTSTAT